MQRVKAALSGVLARLDHQRPQSHLQAFDFMDFEEWSALRDELANCDALSVFDDEMHIVGQSGSRISLIDLAIWLIERGRSVGLDTVISELQAYLSDSEVPAYEILAVDGLDFESSREVYEFPNGIKIVHRVEAPVQFLRERSLSHNFGSENYSLMIRPCKLERSFGEEFSDSLKKRPDFVIFEDILLMLSLVTRQGFQAIWSSAVPSDGVPCVNGLPLQMHSRRAPIEMAPPIIGLHVKQASHLYEKFSELTDDQRDRLRIPLKKLNEHLAETDRVQSAIDLRVCLDALFLKEGEKTEMVYRCALRAALFVGEQVAERAHIKKVINTCYTLGSRAIHTGRLELKPKEYDALNEARNIAKQAIEKLLDCPETDWSQIELSGTTDA